MNRRIPRTAALVLAGALTLAACGQTRYVVVQSGGAAPATTTTATPASTAAAGSSGAAGAAAAPTTTAVGATASTAPAASGDTPAATTAAANGDPTPTAAAAAGTTGAPRSAADDEAGISKALATALSMSPDPFAKREPFIDGGDDLEPTITATNEVLSGVSAKLDVKTTTVTGDTAAVVVDVIVNDAPYSAGLPVDLVRVGGTWKVTRAGACTILALASPCPDA